MKITLPAEKVRDFIENHVVIEPTAISMDWSVYGNRSTPEFEYELKLPGETLDFWLDDVVSVKQYDQVVAELEELKQEIEELKKKKTSKWSFFTKG